VNSTQRVYNAGIKKYLQFCNLTAATPTPSSEQLLCRFVTSLALDNISANSIKVYLSAVHQLHMQRKLQLPPLGDMARLAQVVRGIRIAQTTIRPLVYQVTPITLEILRKIKAAWQESPIDDGKAMLWAAFLTAFFGFMRSRELYSHSSHEFDPS